MPQCCASAWPGWQGVPVHQPAESPVTLGSPLEGFRARLWPKSDSGKDDSPFVLLSQCQNCRMTRTKRKNGENKTQEEERMGDWGPERVEPTPDPTAKSPESFGESHVPGIGNKGQDVPACPALHWGQCWKSSQCLNQGQRRRRRGLGPTGQLRRSTHPPAHPRGPSHWDLGRSCLVGAPKCNSKFRFGEGITWFWFENKTICR